MPINLDDPRVRKTRRGLREAFVRLILRKGYDAITIQDIADEAETARVTFYRHYGDKEELLTDCLDTLYQGLKEKMPPILDDPTQPQRTPVHIFYEHLEEHEDLYLILFSSRGIQAVVEHIRQLMATRLIERFSDLAQNVHPDVPLDIIAYHAASAQIGLGAWWLKNGKPYPVDYMAQVARWLSLEGVWCALGIEEVPLTTPRLFSHVSQ
jgi:AcrR family transcriptional regulator